MSCKDMHSAYTLLLCHSTTNYRRAVLCSVYIHSGRSKAAYGFVKHLKKVSQTHPFTIQCHMMPQHLTSKDSGMNSYYQSKKVYYSTDQDQFTIPTSNRYTVHYQLIPTSNTTNHHLLLIQFYHRETIWERAPITPQNPIGKSPYQGLSPTVIPYGIQTTITYKSWRMKTKLKLFL